MLCRRLGVGSQQSWRRLADTTAPAAASTAGSPAAFTSLTAGVTHSDRGGASACTRSRQLASAGGGGWASCSHQLPFAARAFHAALAPAARGGRDSGGAVEGAVSGDERARVVEEVKQMPRKQQECVCLGRVPPPPARLVRRTAPALHTSAPIAAPRSGCVLSPDVSVCVCFCSSLTCHPCAPRAGTR